MKALLALLLITTPAFAGTTITVSVGDVSEVWTLSDTDQQKFEAWVQNTYKCTGPPDCVPLTLAESEALWAKATLQGTADNVTRFQNILASTVAVEAIAPIGFEVKGSPTSTTVPGVLKVMPKNGMPPPSEPKK